MDSETTQQQIAKIAQRFKVALFFYLRKNLRFWKTAKSCLPDTKKSRFWKTTEKWFWQAENLHIEKRTAENLDFKKRKICAPDGRKISILKNGFAENLDIEKHWKTVLAAGKSKAENLAENLKIIWNKCWQLFLFVIH